MYFVVIACLGLYTLAVKRERVGTEASWWAKTKFWGKFRVHRREQPLKDILV